MKNKKNIGKFNNKITNKSKKLTKAATKKSNKPTKESNKPTKESKGNIKNIKKAKKVKKEIKKPKKDIKNTEKLKKAEKAKLLKQIKEVKEKIREKQLQKKPIKKVKISQDKGKLKPAKPEGKLKPGNLLLSKKELNNKSELGVKKTISREDTPKKESKGKLKPSNLLLSKKESNSKSELGVKETNLREDVSKKPLGVLDLDKGIKQPTKQPTKQKGVLETYEIEVDKAKVKVEIKREASNITYTLHTPEIGIATAFLLEEIRNELVSATTISMKEITDPAAFNTIKQRFMQEASSLIQENLPNINPKIKEFLVGKLMQDMLGLGEIEFLINDLNLEEIVILSSKEFVRVYHEKYGWLPTNLKIAKEDEIINYSNIIARRVGRQITVLTPLLDAHLVTGDRVNAVLYPIATKGNTITIRKFARDPFTIIDLINNKTCSLDIAAMLWLAIEYEMNILISGGTASGKTVLLNCCMPFIPPNHRIISVEDTRELMLPDFLYWTPLVTRTPNPEGKGEVSMLHLLINSLRMRPDRIVLGEMRRKEEAMVLFEAMHTGHSVYATVHADSAAETISRLTNPPIEVPPNLLKAVNLNVVMFRDRKKGIRRILQIAEFEASQDRAEANILYRWIPEQDKIIKHSESSRFFEDISRNTGMPQTELDKNLEEKKKILSWLIKNKIRDLNDFGKVMNFYYTNKELLIKFINKNNVKAVLGR